MSDLVGSRDAVSNIASETQKNMFVLHHQNVKSDHLSRYCYLKCPYCVIPWLPILAIQGMGVCAIRQCLSFDIVKCIFYFKLSDWFDTNKTE